MILFRIFTYYIYYLNKLYTKEINMKKNNNIPTDGINSTRNILPYMKKFHSSKSNDVVISNYLIFTV